MSEITTSTITYAQLSDQKRGMLLGKLSSELSGQPEALMEALTLASSDQPMTIDHMVMLGMRVEYRVLVTRQDHNPDVLVQPDEDGWLTVTRSPKGRRPVSLAGFLASLDGTACNIDPADVSSVVDASGETVTVEHDGAEIDIVETKHFEDTTGILIGFVDGTTERVPGKGGISGHDRARDIVAFSRDGGESWYATEHKVTIPRKDLVAVQFEVQED